MPKCVVAESQLPRLASKKGKRKTMPRKLTIDQAMEGTIKFSEKYVEKGHYEFFPEPEVVRVVQEGLAENQVNHGYRYCP